jgi:hypothetical protein
MNQDEYLTLLKDQIKDLEAQLALKISPEEITLLKFLRSMEAKTKVKNCIIASGKTHSLEMSIDSSKIRIHSSGTGFDRIYRLSITKEVNK